jgi:DNA polymerase III delta subunit
VISIPLVTVLSGDDSLGREKAKEQLLENLFQTYNSFEEEFFDSSRESLSEFLTRLLTPTIFGDVRLFTLKHVQRFSKDELKELAEVISIPHDNLHILIEYESAAGKNTAASLKLSKLKERDDVAIHSFSKPKKYLMPKWLTEQVKQLFGRSIEMSAAEQLLEFTGYELDRIYPELQKIDIYLPADAPITKDAVSTVTGSGKDVSPSDLSYALGHRKWGEAYSSLELLFGENALPVMMLSNVLFRHFWLLYKIRLYAEDNREAANRYFKARYKEKNSVAADIMIAVGFLSESTKNRVYPAVIIPGVIEQATKYSLEELRQVIARISKYDRDVKSGLAETTMDAFSMLCYNIVRTGRSSS